MNENERNAFRDVMLDDVSLSPELKQRFENQIRSIIRPKLTRELKVRNYFVLAVFIPLSIIFAFMAYMVTPARDLEYIPKALLSISFAGGSLLFLAATILVISELLSGSASGRRRQHALTGISCGFVLIFSIAWLICGPAAFRDPELRSWAGVGILFFWIMAVGWWLRMTSKWQHEDSLIEQKRTQLEIALLREEISGRAGQQKQ